MDKSLKMQIFPLHSVQRQDDSIYIARFSDRPNEIRYAAHKTCRLNTRNDLLPCHTI